MGQIGFIGLGIMGKPMAKNLLRNGYSLKVYDIVPENVENVVAAGAQAAQSIAEVAQACELIVTMLPNSPQVKEVALGEGGILDNAKSGTLLVDMSSIAPNASQEVAAALKGKGIRMLDAPVSGGEPKAVDGTLAVMVGGEEQDFEEALPVLKCMSASQTLCGAIGAGNTTKLANQIIVAVNIAAVGEAFGLAKKAGVDPWRVFDAIKGGLAGSTVMNAKVPMILERNFKPGFKCDLHIKDLNNALDTAQAVGMPVPLTAEVMQMLQAIKLDGEGQSDHAAIAKFYEKLGNMEIQ